jgi:hypothetical protein
MIEQSIVHLSELVKDIDRPVSIYLVHLSSSERDHLVGQRLAERLQVEEALGYEWVYHLAYLPGRLGIVEGLRERHFPV